MKAYLVNLILVLIIWDSWVCEWRLEDSQLRSSVRL